MPRVTIITPCYNGKSFIERTIESVCNQKLTDWEYIIVDDGSTDGSSAVIEKWLQIDSRIRLLRQPNGQRANACNNGLRLASSNSDFLLFLDADDYLEPDMLLALSTYLDDHKQVGLVYCKPWFIDENDNFLDDHGPYNYLQSRLAPYKWGARQLPESTPNTPFASVFTLTGIICSISLIRRSVYEETSGWDEVFGFFYDDTDLFLRIALLSEIHFTPARLVRYRRHAQQSTATTNPYHEMQRHKLYSKWIHKSDVTPLQRQTIINAIRFREGGLQLYNGIHHGAGNLKRGHIILALRNFYGTLYGYQRYWMRRLRGEI